MKATAGDIAVVTGSIAGVLFFGGVQLGEHLTRSTIATVCAPQPGAVLAATYQDKSGVTCAYIETPRPAYGRVVRKQKATRT